MIRLQLICEICKFPFEAQREDQKYCGPSCQRIGKMMMMERWKKKHREKDLPEKVDGKYKLTCAYCKKTFFSTIVTARYCSKTCMTRFRYKKDTELNREFLPKEEKAEVKKRTLEDMTPNQLLRYGDRSRSSQLKQLRIQMENDRKAREAERMKRG